MEVKKEDGTVAFTSAKATGQNFFKADAEEDEIEDDMEVTLDEEASLEKPIDYSQDLLIDLERTYSKYRRFNGRAFDDNLEIDDTVSVLIPPVPESTNILLFQLVLLESENIP